MRTPNAKVSYHAENAGYSATARPTCGDCGKTMTPENSTAAPEYFLCDQCAPAHGFKPRRIIKTETAEAAAGSTLRSCSVDWVRLPNDTKIRFVNACTALLRHSFQCDECSEYIEDGDGDLCAKGKDIIGLELAYADTHIEFPQNEKGQPRGPTI